MNKSKIYLLIIVLVFGILIFFIPFDARFNLTYYKTYNCLHCQNMSKSYSIDGNLMVNDPNGTITELLEDAGFEVVSLDEDCYKEISKSSQRFELAEVDGLLDFFSKRKKILDVESDYRFEILRDFGIKYR